MVIDWSFGCCVIVASATVAVAWKVGLCGVGLVGVILLISILLLLLVLTDAGMSDRAGSALSSVFFGVGALSVSTSWTDLHGWVSLNSAAFLACILAGIVALFVSRCFNVGVWLVSDVGMLLIGLLCGVLGAWVGLGFNGVWNLSSRLLDVYECGPLSSSSSSTSFGLWSLPHLWLLFILESFLACVILFISSSCHTFGACTVLLSLVFSSFLVIIPLSVVPSKIYRSCLSVHSIASSSQSSL